jgi:tripartite-type tricarboxylate transporter receptor subunit TctC
MRWRSYESVMVFRFVFSRKIRGPATFDFCNNIGHKRPFACAVKWYRVVLLGRLRPWGPHMKRRTFLHLAASVAALSGVSRIARAQIYPARPVTMVVAFAAGGPNDVIGRIMAARMGEILGQPIVVENIVGAGGMTGGYRVVKAPADGYVFLLGGSGSIAQAQSLYKHPLYDPTTDFTPVGLFVEYPYVLIARNALPANNLQEFITYAKANQAAMQYGSGGSGSGVHIACVLLNAAIGLNVTHVPYRGSGPAMQDLAAGRTDYMCDVIATVMPQVEGKTVKAIAQLSRERAPALPNLPTAHEQGLTDFDAPGWYSFFLPKGTPDPIVQRLKGAMSAAVDSPVLRERLASLGMNVVPPERRTPEYLAKFLPAEIARWAGPIKASGVSMD